MRQIDREKIRQKIEDSARDSLGSPPTRRQLAARKLEEQIGENARLSIGAPVANRFPPIPMPSTSRASFRVDMPEMRGDVTLVFEGPHLDAKQAAVHLMAAAQKLLK